MRKDYNFMAYSPSLNRRCEHMHHTERKAMACAEHLGWADARPLKVYQNTVKRTKVPEYVDAYYDNTNVHQATVEVRFVAYNQHEVDDLSAKIANHLLKNINNVVKADVIEVKAVTE